jgi:hypothetical protein
MPSGRSFREEAVVSGVPKWGRSSKRRLGLIRWTAGELVSIGFLTVLLSAAGFALAVWMAGHPFD